MVFAYQQKEIQFFLKDGHFVSQFEEEEEEVEEEDDDDETNGKTVEIEKVGSVWTGSGPRPRKNDAGK